MISELRPVTPEQETEGIVIDRAISYIYVQTGLDLERNGFKDCAARPVDDKDLSLDKVRIIIPSNPLFGIITSTGLDLHNQYRQAMENERDVQNFVRAYIATVCTGLKKLSEHQIKIHQNGDSY